MLGFGENMVATKWGLKNQEDRYTTIMIGTNPFSDSLLKIVYNCSTGCNTQVQFKKRYGLECTSDCVHCQDSHFKNIYNATLLDKTGD